MTSTRNKLKSSPIEQGTQQNPQTYLPTTTEQGISIKEAIGNFLLSCKVEGKSYGTIECYSDKLKGFLWYASNYHWHDDTKAVTTQHMCEFVAYIVGRDITHLFNIAENKFSVLYGCQVNLI